MPLTPRGNQLILVVTDHFTRWQDALAIPDVTAPVVATALDERIFCYLGLPEQLHADQGAQFESALMAELCHLWGIDKTSKCYGGTEQQRTGRLSAVSVTQPGTG